MAQERTITSWAGEKLDGKLAGLTLSPGVTTGSALDGGFMSGEVTIGERKGKNYPIYSLEVEVPWSGSVAGKECSGTVRLPDVSMEMLEDLEIELTSEDAQDTSALDMDVVQTAVREWAAEIRKSVAENAANLPLDPQTESQTPRAAALISDEEAMSAGGAAALDDADDDVEEVPRQDDEGEEEPFTEEEVAQMLDEVKQALREAFPDNEGAQQVAELEEEIGKTADVQEKGRMLMDVMDYLQNPQQEGEEGEEGDGGEDDGGDPPYPGEKGLKELWHEVTELCNEEDVDRLEDELKGKSGEEQWNILLDVRDYLLNGDEEEQQAFAEWNPTLPELESEWKQMLKRVPPEEVKEVQEDWKGAGPEDKKRMVWDVRKFLEQQDAEGEEDAPPPAKGPPPKGKPPPKGPPPTVDDPEMGAARNEVRRRGARRGAEYEYNYEYDVPGGKDHDSGEWDDYYSKESKRSKSGRSPMVIAAGVLLLGSLTVMLTAAATADEEESVTMSAMRLLRMR